MNYLMNIQKRMRWAFAPALYLFAFLYVGFHTVQGNNGLLSLHDLRTDLEQVTAMAHEAREERIALEMKVGRLRADNLDKDLLDERAREVLGLGRSDEVVVFLDRKLN